MNLIDLIYILLGYHCPPDMVQMGKTCIDKYEAPNVLGKNPIVMVTANDAEKWCANNKKRLCFKSEWLKACRGVYKTPPVVLASGIIAAPAVCNNDKPWRTVHGTTLVLGTKKEREQEALRLWQGETSGSRPNCVGDYGVYDTIGNVEEWVIAPDDKYGVAIMGHYWSRAARSCTHRVSSHDRNFFYYSTGFRCCKDADQ